MRGLQKAAHFTALRVRGNRKSAEVVLNPEKYARCGVWLLIVKNYSKNQKRLKKINKSKQFQCEIIT